MSKRSDKGQVFLSYANEDLGIVRKLYEGLKRRGVNIWFDKVDIRSGKWFPQIMKAIARSRYFLICISEAALKKTGTEPGFQDDELNRAYEIAMMQSDATFTIVPVRLEDCDRGDKRLSLFQQYDLFRDWDRVLNELVAEFGEINPQAEEQEFLASLYNKALTLYYAGDYRKSIDTWSYIETQVGKSFQTVYNKGVVLGSLELQEEALPAFQEALAMKPGDPYALNGAGVTLTELGRYEKAFNVLTQAVEAKPDFLDGLYNRANALLPLSRYEEALKGYEQVLALRRTIVKAWQNKGYALQKLGRYKEALDAYKEGLKLDPENAALLKGQRITLREQGSAGIQRRSSPSPWEDPDDIFAGDDSPMFYGEDDPPMFYGEDSGGDDNSPPFPDGAADPDPPGILDE